MRDTSRVETREIADEELDHVAGGLGVSGTISGLTADFKPGLDGLPMLTSGSIKSLSLSVTDIPLGPISL